MLFLSLLSYFLFFAEVPTVMSLIGGALIILGGYLIFRAQSNKKPAQ